MPLTGFAPSISFAENTVNAAPQLLDADVVFTDAEGDFDGGSLTLSGLLAEDTVSVRNEGSGAGQIGLSGANVTYGGVVIGTLSGGVGATLTITFNAAATSAAIDALIQNLTYANSSDTPTETRTLTLNVTDAAGNDLAGTPAFTVQAGADNPFNGVDVGYYSKPTFADLDGDGDLDALVGEWYGTLLYYENTGTALAPVFVQQTGAENPFNGVYVGGFATPTFADLDGDGDLDALVGASDGLLLYYENTGTALAPVFVQRTGAENPFNGVDVGGFATPTFADLDGDGDLDALVGEFDGVFNYYENTGTALAPVFVLQTGADNPFNGIDVGYLSAPTFADLDGDGDLDALVGDNIGVLNYYENTTAPAPSITVTVTAESDLSGPPALTGFAPSISFAENTVNAAPQLLDADVVFTDADGDFDGGSLTLSGLLVEDTVSVRNEGAGAGQIGLSGANVTYGGVVIGTLSGGVGATLTITFNAAATSAAIDALIQNLTYANSSDTPTASRDLTLNVTDAAGNGLAGDPAFTPRAGADNPFNGVDAGSYSTPAFADLDGDGDLDALVGEQDGVLNYYENTGTALAPVFVQQTGADNPFNGVDVGYRATPTFADLDGDGDLDAVVGELLGALLYYENTGTASAPVFVQQTGADNPFDGVDVGHWSAPTFADLDDDGDLDALVGEYEGTLLYYENTGTALAPVFVQRTGTANPFDGVDVGYNSAPAFADLDGDGDLDALIGAYQGTLVYYENTGTALAPEFTLQTGAANPFGGVDVGRSSSPTFVDLDGDGDLDALVGEFLGTLLYYENTTAPLPSITVTVTAENDTPTLTGVASSVTFLENTVNAAAQLVDSDVTFADVDGSFAGGSLTVTGLLAQDTVSIRNQGNTAGLVGLSGGTLTYGGVTIGTVSGGAGGTLTISFNASATAEAVDAVIQNLTYANSSDTPTASRVLTITATDGGGLAASAEVTVNVTAEDDITIINGTSGADTLTGTAGADDISGRGGNDILLAGDGDDRLDGGRGADTLNGGQGADFLNGGADNDRLDGGEGNDTLRGGTGNDVLIGGAGDDVLDSGAGSDIFLFNIGLFGADTIIDFGNGLDRIQFSGIAGVDDFTDLMITAVAGGVLVTLPDGSSITIEGMIVAQTDASDFIFGP